MNDIIPAPPRPSLGLSINAKLQRRKVFIAAYLANGNNGKQAAITAGWSEGNASRMAALLLKEPSVMAQLEMAAREVAARMGLTVERTLQEVARLAYADPRKFYHEDGSLETIPELDDDAAAMVASIEQEDITEGRGQDARVIGQTKKIKTWDKNAALEKALKIHGLYTDKTEHTGTIIIQAHRLDADI